MVILATTLIVKKCFMLVILKQKKNRGFRLSLHLIRIVWTTNSIDKKQRSHDITGTTNYYVSWSYIKDLFYWIDKGYEKGCGEVIEVFLISYYTCIYSLSLKFISKIHTANLPVFSQFISIGPSKMHCDCSDLWFWFTSIIDKFHLSIEL